MLKLSLGLRILLVLCLMIAGELSVSGTIPAYAGSLPQSLNFMLVTSGLTQPVFITNAGDDSNRLFIVQQTGQIRIFKNGSLLPTPFLNISGLVSNFTGTNGEQGMLSLAFDPNYTTNGNFYITYTTNNSDPTFIYTTTLARYHVSSGSADLADTTSGAVLLSIPKKYTNHNGGMLAFGPEGFLYMSMGDGGSGGDPDNNAQNLHSMLGKLLRLDVESTPPTGQKYVIPSTNPFFNGSDTNVKKEIWAYGLRNPWRFSFDRSTGDLFIGDVGQNIEEEVDFQPRTSTGGENYGWRIREGNLCYNPSSNCVNPTHYVAPVTTYDHGINDSYGCALIGGYIYRGTASPALEGVYFYGDVCSGKVLGLIRNPDNTWSSSLISSTNYSISSFGQDEQGEMYLADYGTGNIYKIYSNAPIATTLKSPSGDIGANYNPTYIWNQVANSTWYYLWVNGPSGNVIKQWYTFAQANCNGTTCSVAPATTLNGGAFTWWVETYNSDGNGLWSDGMPFSMPMPPVPTMATLITPSGNIGTNYNPTYTWNQVPTSTWYQLSVDNTSGNVIMKWYTSAQAACNGSTCSVTPSTTLAGGAYTWMIQTYNSSGSGPWSSPMGFSTTVPNVPTAARLVTPTGSIGTNYNPTYTWNQVTGSTWYQLSVDGPSGNVILQWYTSAQAACNGTTCSVTPALTLPGGTFTWKVMTYNTAGNGPWSTPMSFSTTIASVPGVATLSSPTGSIGTNHNPTYIWNEVPGSTWYYLWVNGPSGNIYKQWYTSAQANCNGTTCSVAPATTLIGGAYTWWVETYNSAGNGPWSSGMNFTVSP